MSAFRQKIKDFYAKHPYHIKVDVNDLLNKYAGLEEELWLAILDKYPEYHNFEKELMSLAQEAGVIVNSGKVKSFLEQNPKREAAALRYFYNKNCLSKPTFTKRKLKEVYKSRNSDFNPASLLDEFKGHEGKIFRAVGGKYLTDSPTPVTVKADKPIPPPSPKPTAEKEEFKPLRDVFEEKKKEEATKPVEKQPPKPVDTPAPKPAEAKKPEPAKVEEKAVEKVEEKVESKVTPETRKGGIPKGVIIAGQVLLALVAVVAIAFGVYVATDMRIAAIDKLLGNSPSVEEKVEELKTVQSEGSTVQASEFFSEEELREMAEQESADSE